jgi:hypothetical protein
MSSLQNALKQERISCQFTCDYENYNHGESAVFNSAVAHMLKRRGAVAFNEHKVRNDTNLQALIEGKNQPGMNESEVARIVENKIENLLGKNLEKIIAEQMKLFLDKQMTADTLPKSAIRKS